MAQMITVPLDYYKLLGVSRASPPPSIQRAVEDVLAAPLEPEAPYTLSILEQRSAIIQDAARTLLDPARRSLYDKGLRARKDANTEVPLSQLAGALCLLHEIGQLEAAVDVGEAYLRGASGFSSATKDIALVTAIARCDLAAAILESESARSLEDGYEELELALRLLQKYALAKDVQAEVAVALAGMAAEYALEMVKRPLEEAAERARGVEILKRVLWGRPLPLGVPAVLAAEDRRAYLAELQGLLTASEQVAIFDAAPGGAADAQDKYDAALALVGLGLMEAKPGHIARANRLLQAVAKHDIDEGNKATVVLELAVCELLLGDTGAALAYLGLEDPALAHSRGIAGIGEDASATDFVVSNSPDGSYEGSTGELYLEGICALGQEWVNNTLIPGLPEMRGCDFTLEEWFEEPGVAAQLTALERTRWLGIDSAAAGLADGVRRAASGAAAAGAAVFGAVAGGARGLGGGRGAPLGAESSNGRGAALAPSGAAWSDAPAGRGGVMSAVRAAGPRTVGAAALGALALLAVASVVRSRPGAGGAAPLPLARVRAAPAPEMSVTVAEAVVRQWQTVKARALGKEHDTAALSEVLAGRMLQQWKARAADVQHQGWYWEYALGSLSIDSVEVSEDGERAIVEATLEESARLIENGKGQARPADRYRSTYSAQYQMVKRGGAWKVVGGKVLHR